MNKATKIVTQGILYLITLPVNIVGWVAILVSAALWGDKPHWKDGVLTTNFRADSWIMKNWFKNWAGSTLGHSVFMAPTNSSDASVTWKHELVHVEQFQVRGMIGTFILLAVVWWNWWLALILWALLPTMSYLAAGLVALLRGESFYRGNTDEESAYAQENH